MNTISSLPCAGQPAEIRRRPPLAIDTPISDPQDNWSGPLPEPSAPPSTAPLASRAGNSVGWLATLANWLTAVRDVVSGAQRDSQFEYQRTFPDEPSAISAFEAAQQRLLHPNRWSQLGHRFLGAEFQLVRHLQKQPEEVTPEQGDYIQIHLPDPGPAVWVKLESLETKPDSVRVVVRPSEDPRRSTPNTIIHLFGQETTNVFELQRQGTTVTARVSGKDETPNTTGNLFQDLLAGARLTGAWAGLKNPQWNAFVRNLVDGPPIRPGLARQGLASGLAAALGMQQTQKSQP